MSFFHVVEKILCHGFLDLSGFVARELSAFSVKSGTRPRRHVWRTVTAAEGIDVTQARRLLRFTLLAPAVVEPLLANPDVAINRVGVLRRVVPLDWEEQCVVFPERALQLDDYIKLIK